jgi:hypothetical protein
MAALPATGQTPVIRTDFSDSAGWEAARAAILAPGAEAALFAAHVDFVDDPDFAGYTAAQILDLVTDDIAARHPCLFIVDTTTLTTADWPVLVLGLRDEAGQLFRTVADELHGIEANLSVANMDFSFYADFADEAGGVFRGGGPPRSVTATRLRQAMEQWPGSALTALLRPQEPPAQ